MTTATLLRAVLSHYKKHKRDFPWRHTRDPYRILVSEIMLQQTQAGRVVPFYKKFITEFPTARALASTPLSKVLRVWQGLGYNRRAKYLRQAAEILSGAKVLSSAKTLRSGEMNGRPTPPRRVFAPEFWETLPGVGHYTARAIMAFAFNKPEVFIETNIRTVFTHFFFPTQEHISDADILPFVERALKKSQIPPRDFYAALMDYGAFLKAGGVRLNAKSKHYIKQSKFEGSARQLRGALLRELLKKPQTASQLTKNLRRKPAEVKRELERLQKEQLITQQGGRYSV